MTLAGRIRLKLLVLLLCIACLGCAATFGVVGLKRHFDTAGARHEQLRTVYEIGHRAASARLLLNDDQPDAPAIDLQIARALRELDALQSSSIPHEHAQQVRAMRDRLMSAARRITDEHDAPAGLAAVNAALGDVATLAGALRESITATRQAATTQLRTTSLIIAGLGLLFTLVGLDAARRLHRSVLRPMRELDHAVGELSRAHFRSRITPHGDREFRALMHHVNRMADEIEQLHTSMQQQIDERSRQLLGSERLVSVGTLAAGLAHEINNPLGIIAGYAEAELRRLDRAGAADADAADRLRRTLRIIAEEAFRCRDMTSNLLDVAAASEGEAEPVDLPGVVHRAVQLVHVLPVADERAIVVRELDEAAHLHVSGRRGQLLQVLLNVITNALEACEAGAGRVTIELRRRHAQVVVSVIDNGCGLGGATAAQVFEPFFTDKPQRGLRGAGLGLWVAHAIIEQHGGRITARDNGPEAGSTFTIELPAQVSAEVCDHVG